MKISEMILSAVLKKGILYESTNCDMEIDIPASQLGLDKGSPESKITIRFKAENISVRIEKE